MFSNFDIFCKRFLWRRYRKFWKCDFFLHLVHSYVQVSFRGSGRRWEEKISLKMLKVESLHTTAETVRSWPQRHYDGIVMTFYGRFVDFDKFSQIGTTVFLLALNTFPFLLYSLCKALNSWFWTDFNSSTKRYNVILEPNILKPNVSIENFEFKLKYFMLQIRSFKKINILLLRTTIFETLFVLWLVLRREAL